MIKDVLEQNKEKIISEYISGKSTCQLGRDYNCSGGSIYLFLQQNNIQIRKVTNIDDCKDILIELFNSGKSAYNISKQLDMNCSTVERYLKRLGFDLSSRCRNHEIPIRIKSKEIIDDYLSGKGCTVLSKKYGCSETTILKILSENNIDTIYSRKYTFNEEFFDKIDTEEKAYFLGFFFADGNNNTTQLRLSITDKDVVEKFKTAVNYDGPIKEVAPRKKGWKTQYLISLCSTKICDGARRCGCIENKTFFTRLPKNNILPFDLIRHFLRGLLDGDGSIIKNKKNKYWISYVGPEDFMSDISRFLDINLDIQATICLPSKKTTNSIRHLIFGGNIQVKYYLDWLYKDAKVYMDRKYKRYQEMCII